LASPDKNKNYRSVWSRDGVIIGLAAMMTDDEEMVGTFGNTLLTLAAHQGPHGEIPSNVEENQGRISYGSTTERVDSDLWFVIGCGEYWHKTKDDEFLKKMAPVIQKIMFLLGAWEFNSKGFLYVPATGDWADEYVHNGYVLYDQLLYLQAQKTWNHLQYHGLKRTDDRLLHKIEVLKRMIKTNFWFNAGDKPSDDVYHEVLFKKGHKAAGQSEGRYWLPFFSPHGYGYRFDAFANVLCSLLGVSSTQQRMAVNDYIDEEVLPEGMKMLPAFHPVIKPVDEDWQELKITFTYTFKNQPHEYHNGGLWPLIAGFYIADMAQHQETDRAKEFLSDLYRANRMSMDGQPWAFPEYIHGRKLTPGGNRHQGWSASSALMGYYSLQGKKVFHIS